MIKKIIEMIENLDLVEDELTKGILLLLFALWMWLYYLASTKIWHNMALFPAILCFVGLSVIYVFLVASVIRMLLILEE
jgi:hypothetical protein